MGKYFIDITHSAKKHIKSIQKSGDHASIKAIEQIIIELSQEPYDGKGKPEALKYAFKGYWSRRINKKDRLIYHVNEKEKIVTIISSKGHYEDK